MEDVSTKTLASSRTRARRLRNNNCEAAGKNMTNYVMGDRHPSRRPSNEELAKPNSRHASDVHHGHAPNHYREILNRHIDPHPWLVNPGGGETTKTMDSAHPLVSPFRHGPGGDVRHKASFFEAGSSRRPPSLRPVRDFLLRDSLLRGVRSGVFGGELERLSLKTTILDGGKLKCSTEATLEATVKRSTWKENTSKETPSPDGMVANSKRPPYKVPSSRLPPSRPFWTGSFERQLHRRRMHRKRRPQRSKL
jgi:hypothetical protein